MPPARERLEASDFDGESAGLSSLLDRLVTVDPKTDPWKHEQAHRVVRATLLLMGCSLLFLAIDQLRSLPASLMIGLGVGALFGIAILFVLRLTGSPRLAGHLLCIDFLAVLVHQSLMDTGLTNPAVVPTLMLPWVASFTLGAMAAILYAGAAVLLYLGLYALHVQGHTFPFMASNDDIHVFLVIIYVMMVSAIAGIGYLYEQRRKKAFIRQRLRADARAAAQASGPQELIRPEVLNQLAQDLRIPLLDVIGLGSVLESQEPPTASYGRLIAQNGHQMIELLNAVDELAWLKRGEAQPAWEQVDISAEVERALAPLQELARQRGVSLWIESGASEILVETDRRMMNHLITLLTKSAIMNARQGRISVKVDVDESLKVCVKSPGVDRTTPQVQSAPASASSRQALTSFNLSVAEELASKMNGRLKVNFAPDRGFAYSAVLPASNG